MARISRKQLKQDRFAEEVGQSVVYVSSHRKQILVWGVIAVAAVVGILAFWGYRSTMAEEAEEELRQALAMYHGVVDTEQHAGKVTFPTTIARYRDTTAQLEKVIENYSGQDEAATASYYLALLEIEQEKLEEAESRLQSIVNEHEGEYAALARLALADLYARQNEDQQARQHYQYLIDNPTRVVPKPRAQIAYARYLFETDKEEARTFIEELREQPGPAGVTAARMLQELEGS